VTDSGTVAFAMEGTGTATCIAKISRRLPSVDFLLDFARTKYDANLRSKEITNIPDGFHRASGAPEIHYVQYQMSRMADAGEMDAARMAGQMTAA